MHVRTAIIILLAAATLSGQSRGDWPMFGHDYASTRYSPLTQITTKNVGNLKQAWIYHFRTDEERKRSEEHTSELQSQSNLVCRLLLEKKKKITTQCIFPVQSVRQRFNS